MPAESEWDTTVIMATIPPRASTLLQRALRSIYAQQRPAKAVVVETDLRHEGAWVTRQRALDQVRTPWTAVFDDDDEMLPEHLRVLSAAARAYQADYVFSYFQTVGFQDPFTTPDSPLGHFGRYFDPADPHHTTSVILVRTELAQAIGYSPPDPSDIVGGEDWRFTLAAVEMGAKIVHVPRRTWLFHWHPQVSPNTSGQPHNWDSGP